MPTQALKFSGKVKWCRPDQVNEWGKFSTRFYPDEASLPEMKKLSTKNQWKTDEDGEFTNVSCPEKREYRGRTIINKVIVTDKDGNPHYTDVHGFVGDGSDVDLWVDYYDHPIAGSARRGHAIKWTGLTVRNLVPYKLEAVPATVDPGWH